MLVSLEALSGRFTVFGRRRCRDDVMLISVGIAPNCISETESVFGGNQETFRRESVNWE